MKLLVVLLAIVQLAIAANICYDGYGCYTTDPPFFDLFVRPIVYLPQRPEIVATKFILYTRYNPKNGVTIDATNPSILFNPNSQTRFIVHGFLHDGTKNWIMNIKDALLRVEDSNVIVVDWSKGNGWPYEKAASNTQIVGTDIAILVKSYMSRGLLTPDHVHIIGHSLGSHVAGYAGERITPKIARITGLDPAGPAFENSHIRVRLDPTDAQFVDVIHSDGAATLALGLGMMQQVGDVDFYPNGGKDQPNCPKTSGKILGAIFGLLNGMDMDIIDDTTSCSHMAATHFYANSIESQDCQYTAYPCSNLKDFNNGDCISCSAKGCNRMGHWASPNKDQGKLMFTTQDATRTPYCYNHYTIRAVSNRSGLSKTKGKFTVNLTGSKKSSVQYIIDDGETMLSPGDVVVKLAESNGEIGDILGARVSFEKNTCLLFCAFLDTKWSFTSIEISDGQSQKYTRLCPTQTYINTGSYADFRLC